MDYKFPKDFLWGTATSGHQIEGNNTNSDWWRYEQTKEEENRKYPLEPSGIACDSYNRYEEDFDLAKQLNNNAVRVSIEWARIEPKQGEFSEEAIHHYRKVLKAAKDRGLKTFVTLHHFASPIWFAELGGWHGIKSAALFEKYAAKCAKVFDDLIDAYLTINEPQVYTLLGYTTMQDWEENNRPRWVPSIESRTKAFAATINFIRAHRRAYKTIKKINPKAQVGIVKNITWWETDPFDARMSDVLYTRVLNFLSKGFFLIPLKNHLDFIGLNYYFTNRMKGLKQSNPNDYVSDLGWWINPVGLEKILDYLKGFDIPIYITENGIADKDDRLRKKFIQDHLIAVSVAIENGAKVKGYFHWSLLDNYEWHEGYWPKFGLVEIDRDNNLERKPRESYYYYAEICKNNKVFAEY